MSFFRRTQIEAIPGTIDVDNSTTVPLGSNASFIPDAVDVSNYKSIIISIYTDQGSAEDGLKLQFSINGTNWDFETVYTIHAGDSSTIQVPIRSQFFRINYTNGPIAQSEFRLQTIFQPTATIGTTRRLAAIIDDQEPAEMVRSVVAGQNYLGDFDNVGITADNRLKVSQVEAYEGRTFSFINAVQVPDGTTLQFILDVPNDLVNSYHVHFTFETNAKNDYIVEFYYDATCSDIGVVVTDPPLFNRNLGISWTDRPFHIYAFPTVEYKGNIISRYYVPGGKATSSVANKPNEIIIPMGYSTLVEISNVSGSSMYISWVADFIVDYESSI